MTFEIKLLIKIMSPKHWGQNYLIVVDNHGNLAEGRGIV